MITAGQTRDISSVSGKWIILDIGFANTAESNGLLIDHNPPITLKFNDAVTHICDYIANNSPVNLVIEAPLSVAFDQKGNPKGRSIEKLGSSTRYWYVGLGCAVTIAAMYLIRAIHEAAPDADIRLFEGFVSFKKQGKKSNHIQDVNLLREVVDDPDKFSQSIIEPNSLKMDSSDSLKSSFWVMGIDTGIPPVIVRNG